MVLNLGELYLGRRVLSGLEESRVVHIIKFTGGDFELFEKWIHTSTIIETSTQRVRSLG